MDSRDLYVLSEFANLAEQNVMPSSAAALDNTTDSTAPAASSTAVSRTKAKQERRAAKAALHNAQQGHESSKQTRRTTRYAVSQFPLLRLPAELRNNVYTHVLASSAHCALKGFKIPPLLQVSKQIRSDTVGLPTTINGIELAIRSNYIVLSSDQTPVYQRYFHHDIGLLQIDSKRCEWLNNDEVVFRDIKIVVQCACCPKQNIGSFLIGILDGGYAVKSQVWYALNLENIKRVFKGIEADIKEVLEQADAINGFAGLKLGDLEKVAKCFHWVEPAKSDGK